MSDNETFSDYFLELLDDKIKLYRFHPELFGEILGYILPLLTSTKEFFSITKDNKEYSLFIPANIGAKLEHLSFVCLSSDVYCVLKLFTEDHQINESGVVNKITQLFASHDVPILFINSYSQNFVLFPERELQYVCSFLKVFVGEVHSIK